MPQVYFVFVFFFFLLSRGSATVSLNTRRVRTRSAGPGYEHATEDALARVSDRWDAHGLCGSEPARVQDEGALARAAAFAAALDRTIGLGWCGGAAARCASAARPGPRRSAEHDLLDQITLLYDRYPMQPTDLLLLPAQALNLCALHATRLLESDEDHERCASLQLQAWTCANRASACKRTAAGAASLHSGVLGLRDCVAAMEHCAIGPAALQALHAALAASDAYGARDRRLLDVIRAVEDLWRKVQFTFANDRD